MSEQPFVASYLLSRDDGFLVADASSESSPLDLAVPSSRLTKVGYETLYRPSFGPDRRHVLMGGSGDDTLVGGMEGDILIGGPGNDRLRGNGGGDLMHHLFRTDQVHLDAQGPHTFALPPMLAEWLSLGASAFLSHEVL